MNTGAIILSAGTGKRMAERGIKPLLKIGNKTFLELVVEKADATGFDPVIVIINPAYYDKIMSLNMKALVVVNNQYRLGMLSSLHCGLQHLETATKGFLLNPVDFPNVLPETYAELKATHEKNSNSIIKPVHKGRGGHPVIFPSNFYNELMHAPLTEGARWVLARHPDKIILKEVNDPGILMNINTPELYDKYCN